MWKVSNNGRYDRFKVRKEQQMITKSKGFDSIEEMNELLVKPLNWQIVRDVDAP